MHEDVPALDGRVLMVNKITIGGIYDFYRTEHVKFGIGALVSKYWLPRRAQAALRQRSDQRNGVRAAEGDVMKHRDIVALRSGLVGGLLAVGWPTTMPPVSSRSAWTRWTSMAKRMKAIMRTDQGQTRSCRDQGRRGGHRRARVRISLHLFPTGSTQQPTQARSRDLAELGGL